MGRKNRKTKCIAILAVVSTILICLTGCENKKNEDYWIKFSLPTEKIDENGKIRNYEYKFSSLGNTIIIDRYYEGDYLQTIRRTYSSDGNTIAYTVKRESAWSKKKAGYVSIRNTYDENNNLIEKVYEVPSYPYTRVTKRLYSDKGKDTDTITTIKGDEETTETYVYIYNDYNQLIECRNKDTNELKTEYLYDENGYVNEKINYNDSNTQEHLIYEGDTTSVDSAQLIQEYYIGAEKYGDEEKHDIINYAVYSVLFDGSKFDLKSINHS